MSMWADYTSERLGKLTLEKEYGFVVFHFQGETCFIDDLFIVKEKRLKGLGSQLADEVAFIAKGNGLKNLICTVFPKALNSTESLAAVLAYGFKLMGSDQQYIYMKKEI
jgi:L-amino acid N-acyltransferase YncA